MFFYFNHSLKLWCNIFSDYLPSKVSSIQLHYQSENLHRWIDSNRFMLFYICWSKLVWERGMGLTLDPIIITRLIFVINTVDEKVSYKFNSFKFDVLVEHFSWIGVFMAAIMFAWFRDNDTDLVFHPLLMLCSF